MASSMQAAVSHFPSKQTARLAALALGIQRAAARHNRIELEFFKREIELKMR